MVVPLPLREGLGEGLSVAQSRHCPSAALLVCHSETSGLRPWLLAVAPTGLARRSGFTLIEVLLVLALLVIIAAIAAPLLTSGSEYSQLKRSAEKLRTSWAKARLDAAGSGQTKRFQCRIGSGWGYLTDAGTAPELATAAQSGDVGEETGAAKALASNNGEELSGIVFKQLLVASEPGLPPAGVGVGDGEFSAAIFFRPDGTTSDAEALLESPSGSQLRVTLRGLTGAAKVEDPKTNPGMIDAAQSPSITGVSGV